MFEKIKEFFKSKTVKLISWVFLCLSVASLIIGNVTTADIGSAVEMVASIVAGISLLIAFITERGGSKK